jgi:hypothetical protein
MINIENHIILDNIKSWPLEVISLIKSSEKELKGYIQEEHRIDKLGRDDLSVRYNRPYNSYTEEWTNTINNLEKVLAEHSIVGFHCTKLMDSEILDIQSNGLQPLSKDFANQRVNKLFEQNLISQDLKNELENKEELSSENRIGKIFVFHCLSTLKDEWGLNRLFGYWGGESLYAYLKSSRELKQIGTSCIVITSIKINELDIYPELSKRMIAVYFNDNYYPHDTDSIIESKLDVVKIIKREDKLFEQLTDIHEWSYEI